MRWKKRARRGGDAGPSGPPSGPSSRRGPSRGPVGDSSDLAIRVRRARRVPTVWEKVVARLLTAALLLTAVIVGGGLVLYALGRGRWSFAEALYLSLITVSTVGYRELDGMDQVHLSYVATGTIIVAGLVAVAYFQSIMTALLVDGFIGERLRERRMQKKVDGRSDHIVVAGAGSTGIHAIEELYASREDFVVIDRDRDVLERISRDLTGGEMLYVVGDATEDAVLLAAGVSRCRGVVAALTEDKDNLFVTLSARSLNARARIVSKVIAPDSAPKMVRAGANATVSPNMMGGRRLASEIVRPTVVAFIDKMLRERDALRLEEVAVPDGSPLLGKPLWEIETEKMNLLVVALRVDTNFIYNPEPGTLIEVGSELVVLGSSSNVTRLRALLRGNHNQPSKPHRAKG